MNRRLKRSLAIALLVVLMVVGLIGAIPWFAGASHQWVSDPKDTPGILDISKVVVSGKKYNPNFKTVTYKRWKKKALWDKGYIIINLDLRGDSHHEHFALITSNGQKMTATLYKNPKGQREKALRALKVWRPNRRSVTVRIPLRKRLGSNRTFYRWHASSLLSSNACASVCIDRAPNSGAVREVLVAPEPEPSPSPTPTSTEAP